jgi:uncharacterized protein (DUF885 family)
MRFGLFALLLLLSACGARQSDFREWEDRYWGAWLAYNPTAATSAGVHDHDAKLEDLSAQAFAERIAELERFSRELAALDKEGFAVEDVLDAEVLKSAVAAELADVRDLKSWQSNPMNYVAIPGGAIDALMKRNFAPAAERLRAATGRLCQVPDAMEAMKQNVRNPPREFTDLAVRMAGGSVGFYRETVPAWAREAAGGDGNLMSQFSRCNERAVAAVSGAEKYLRETLLPASRGNYAIGEAAFLRKLRLEEMVDMPLAELLAIGEKNLERDYLDFVATARSIDSRKTPAQVMGAISDDHPTEEDLVPATRRTLESIRQFVREKQIIELPTDVLPRVEETPPYARAGSFASMDTPGAYETRATEAFYYVTPPEKDWDAAHKREHLRLFNKPVLDIITIHEAFPGHYTQFVYARQFPTKTRKLYACGSNAEGWAHYTEQMMLEEGFGAGNQKLKLAQLSEALLRDCRYVAGVKLHTKGMSVEEGARLFVEKCFQEPANAYEEARRGAYNPTYLYYTLGKLQIYELREDYRRKKGGEFRLGEFHHQFIRQGAIPISLIHRILLGSDANPSL